MSRHDENAEKCERFMSPRFVTTELPMPRHRDGRSVFNPFTELPLLAVLAKQRHYFSALYSDTYHLNTDFTQDSNRLV